MRFSHDIVEYILDDRMQLKAVKLRNGSVIDARDLHRQFNPKHPLLKTPSKIRETLDQFFVHEFQSRRLPAGV